MNTYLNFQVFANPFLAEHMPGAYSQLKNLAEHMLSINSEILIYGKTDISTQFNMLTVCHFIIRFSFVSHF